MLILQEMPSQGLKLWLCIQELIYPNATLKNQIASAINIIIQVSRLQDGSRKVTKVSEIVGMEEGTITMQDIFVWEQTGTGAKTVMGMHVSTGVRPKFIERIKTRGIEVNNQYFDKIIVIPI